MEGILREVRSQQLQLAEVQGRLAELVEMRARFDAGGGASLDAASALAERCAWELIGLHEQLRRRAGCPTLRNFPR